MSADPAASHEPLAPGRVIALDYGSGSNDFRAFHESMADVCELSLAEGQEFRARSRTLKLGAAVLTDMRSCSLQYNRTTRHVARSGYDHFQVHLNLAGESHIRSGRRSAVFRTGDVGILDTALPTEYMVLAPRGKGDARKGCRAGNARRAGLDGPLDPTTRRAIAIGLIGSQAPPPSS